MTNSFWKWLWQSVKSWLPALGITGLLVVSILPVVYLWLYYTPLALFLFIPIFFIWAFIIYRFSPVSTFGEK